ncbi:uncharacterized protein BT62DRAFT_374011 [Guyanagaster necrorhizus]|uniref:Uncharacterized protein n=1 Tax=Guyanagaster necrorhizus TaxID=856835 RepID=A0A9P8AQE2_9AGAR|nr:uncharacterized protein BT62DRAFT_374011 [Guyanagaster necrorhizus MCA 3950]KAG7442777.1 hypothetical protein BT62DRAFT_374011 [Guyanagaster necrorhizus MCA 3950]
MSPSSPSFSTASSHTAESTSEKACVGSSTWTSILCLTFKGASAIPRYSCPRGRNRSLYPTTSILRLVFSHRPLFKQRTHGDINRLPCGECSLPVGRARFTSDHANSDRHWHRLTTNTEGGILHECR